MDKDFTMLMEDLKGAVDKFFERAQGENADIDLTVRTVELILEQNRGNIVVEISLSYVLGLLKEGIDHV